MAPKSKDKEAIAFFTVGHQLGSVGEGLMASAIDEAPGFIDAADGKTMELLLNGEECSLPDFKEDLKKKLHKGEVGPCRMEHIYYMFPKDKK